VSSLAFRQVFSDDITQVIDPRRESTFYANNNTSGFSFNFLASNETTTLFAPSRNPLTPSAGTNFDIKIRQAPEIEATVYPRRVFDSVPVYFSLDSSVGALKREEIADSNVTLVTPAAVQRFDFQPTITVPLATLAGIAITPSLTLRETFYTSGIDPSVPVFDPNIFTFNPADPRIDPKRGEFNPSIKLFDRNSLDRISADSVSRNYAELAVDIRPPSLEKDFLDEEGQTRFKHLIEPSITYRLIGGIGGEFNRIIRFDDRDAVANTNEIEYSLINRFFTRQLSADVTRRRAKGRRTPSMMKPVRPGEKNKAEDKTSPDSSGAKAAEPAVAVPPPEQDAKQKPEPAINKSKLEKGEQAEFEKSTREAQQKQAGRSAKEPDQRAETQETESNQAAVVQPYELLTVKVAQKYFFDRDFGGALVEGRRNQFYPINTLSGFTFGGRARSFSPVNVSMRYRPLSSVYGDLRMDVGSDDGIVRNLSVGAGVRGEKVSVSASYYLSRRIKLDSGSFEPGTFPGNQVSTTIQFGDGLRGAYGGSRIGYDFTNRFISDTEISKGRLMNSRSYIGYAWDCCGLQFNYNTFKAGLRNESAWSVTFTLAGLGSFGTDQFSQLGGGSGGRKRGKRSRRAEDDYFP
jgi:LPS-assembly protein